MNLVLKARYVFPVAGVPIRDGSVTIEGQRIAAVGQESANGEVRDLGNAAILPGLVNAHAHLDFSDLRSPLGKPGGGAVDWIRLVIDHRSNANSRELTAPGLCPVALGLQESVRCGVTTLGEIAQPGWPVVEIAAAPLAATVFQELIAPTSGRVTEALELARSHLRSNINSRGLTVPGYCNNWQPGLSPHAPYSVHRELLAAAVRLSADERVPLAMHMAEWEEELELLRRGAGPLRTFLEQIGAWDATAIAPGSRPLDYLRLLASAHRALVIHGNYLDREEIAFLGANAAHMAVVYCPRTHDWFRHRAYPLEAMLAAGVTVALGTDGRGSSPDLSLLAEMRFAARRHPDVGLDQILRMGTACGACALGIQQRVGTLEPGKQADLTIVALPDRDAADPHELLLGSEEPVVGRCFRGEMTEHA